MIALTEAEPRASRPTLKITGTDSLDARIAEVVRTKIRHTAETARMEAEIASIQKRYAPRLADLLAAIGIGESEIHDFCQANRATLFAERKSRETAAAVVGFELTPPRVETSSRKIKWADVVARLLRLAWGKAYVRQPEPKPDKEALLADREKLTPEQLTAAGIAFAQDEQFFIRPKSESAEDVVKQI